MDILALIAAFGGGIIGAYMGALPAFIMTGIYALVGGVLTAAGVGGDVAVNYLAFGSFVGPHIAFAGGVAAAGYADTIIITSDNPRREDPMKIIGDITSAVNETDVLHEKQVLIIPDRKEAIETALNTAGKGDFVVIAGKGHETYQIIGTKVLHFDDRDSLVHGLLLLSLLQKGM